MRFLITFLEGIISFISPCMLPLLPLYISYFAGGSNVNEKKYKIFLRALSFTAGFTLIFSLMGLFAGTIGAFLKNYQTPVNIITGAFVVLFGFSYMGIIPLNFLKGMKGGHKASGIISAFIFGIIYSVSLTPCVGAFLGSALMLASASGTALTGLLLLIVYSLGLGIPFVISAVLIDSLKNFFGKIKKHYVIINRISGGFLIAIGIIMMLGLMNNLLGVLQL